MTDNYYIYLADLPGGVTEMVTPCADGYTIYINSKIDRDSQMKGYLHAVQHIMNNDFEKEDVQMVEYEAHKKCPASTGHKGN